MQSKIYKNFEVFENGDVWFVKDGYKRKLKPYNVSRNRKYMVVSVSENGKQKMFYVHRLVASAFIPNPEEKPQVNHIDGNPSNNNVKNLEWVTGRENVLHAYKSIRQRYLCEFCGAETFSSKKICASCYDMESWRKKREIEKQKKLEELKNSVDIQSLSEKQKEYFDLYLSGLNYTEISKKFGLTPQAVSHQFRKMKKKTQ